MSTAAPPPARLDPDRLARVDRFLRERYLDTGLLPNAQLLVSLNGETVHFSHQGRAREAGDAPIDAGSLFRIASMTKPITSVAFMALMEEGRVALDTPVHHVLPELTGVGVYAGGGAGAPFQTTPTKVPMRMVDLLRHTAGLTYSFQHRSNIDAAHRELRLEAWHGSLDLDGFVRELGRLPLEFSPGEAWNYSVATDVLGAVVQRLEDAPLDAVFARRVFRPLGMADTCFQVPAAQVDRLVDAYAFVAGRGRVLSDPGADSAWSRPPRLLSGGGGLVSTALDYQRFCLMCLNGGELDGERVLGRKTLALMTRNHLPGGGDLAGLSRSLFSEATNAGAGFGLGFAVTTDAAKALIPGSEGEYYWGGMYSTAFFVDPVERMTMVFMTQLMPSMLYPIRRELKTMLYAALV